MPFCICIKCCWWIDLKTGCFIIGYLNLFIAICLTVSTVMSLVGGVIFVNDNVPQHHEEAITVLIVASILLIFMILALAYAIVLLVGLHKNKPGHLKAYLKYYLIFTIISILNIIAMVSNVAVTGTFLENLLTILLNIYFLLVIRSMYFQMKSPSKKPAV